MLMSRDVHEAAAEVTKIRKRCALSSSSEPRTTRRRLRLKRSVRLIGRTGGGTSPCKTTRSSRNSRRRMSESSWNRQHHGRRLAGVDTRPTSAASARKLVSALWQLDKGVDACEGEGEVGWDAVAARRSSDHHRRSASMELSKLSRRKSRALEGDGERSLHNGHAHGHWFSDVMSNGGTMEGLASPCPGPGDRTAQLQELYTSMTASKELVRVLATVLAPGALNPTASSLLAALRSELDVARARARQLARAQRRCHGGDEAEQQLREEMRAWKSRHRAKAAAAARVVAAELDAERRARQRAERVGKRLGEALAEAEAALREARREVERERTARERVEKVCDELAAGVGVGGAAADEEEEELMRREELEREREMLRVADELREERVRMKLAEARIQFEEKNAVVDRLRQELEAFLGRDDKDGREDSPVHDHERRNSAADDHRLQLVLASEPVVDGLDRVAVPKNGEENDGEVDDDSDGSDIELNVDGHSRDYSWSYGTAASNKETTGARNAASRHGSFSDRGTDGAFDRRSQGLGEQQWDEGCSDDDDRSTAKEDVERYEAIKNLREQMLAGHGFVFLSQQGGAADAGGRDHHHRHPGFVCQVEEGGLW